MSINLAHLAFISFPDLRDYGYQIISFFLALLHEKRVRKVTLRVWNFEKNVTQKLEGPKQAII